MNKYVFGVENFPATGIVRTLICRAVFLLIAVTGLDVSGAAVSSQLKYFKLVQMPGIQSDQTVYILMDQEIFKYSELDYSDIRIFDAEKTEVPLLIDKPAENRSEYPVSQMSLSVDSGGASSTIDIMMNREPVSEILFETDSTGFRAKVTVQKTIGTGFETIATGEISDGDPASGTGKNLIIGIPESRSESYRLIVEGQDRAVPEIQKVRCQGPACRIVFHAKAGASYQLFWGSSEIGAPNYDTTSLLSALAGGSVIKRARIGRGFTNPEQAGRESAAQSPAGHAGVIVGVVLVLLAALIVLVRRRGERET